jgi:hypothetical protein
VALNIPITDSCVHHFFAKGTFVCHSIGVNPTAGEKQIFFEDEKAMPFIIIGTKQSSI